MVFVKVVGFRDSERHALNTIFRLSVGEPATYALWTPEAPVPPHLVLLDTESYEGGLEVDSPGFNKNLKMICVGEEPPASAWRSFARPLDWSVILHSMDELFRGAGATDLDLDTGESAPAVLPPGVRVSMLADASRDNRMYLRARLALSGFNEVSEATDALQALALASTRHHDLVIINLDDAALDGWKLVKHLVALEPAIGSIVLSTRDASWHLQEKAEQAGCRGVLDISFDPAQILDLLRKV
jgi:CheY-like chemotaxis protein